VAFCLPSGEDSRLEHSRRAEILVTNLRWGLLVAILGLANERQGLGPYIPFVLAIAVYNSVARFICYRKDLYSRFWAIVAYSTRLLDIAVITAVLPLYRAYAWQFAGSYLFVAFGAGLVLRWRRGMVLAALSAAAYGVRTTFLLKAGVAASSPKQVLLMAMLCLLAVLISESFSIGDGQEQEGSHSLNRLQALQRLGTAWAVEYGPRQVQIMAESTLAYVGATQVTVTICGDDITPVGITTQRDGGRATSRPAVVASQQQASAPSEMTVVASGQDVEAITEDGKPGFSLSRQVMVKGKKGCLQIEARGLRQPFGDEDRSALAILVSHMSMVLDQAHTAAVLQKAAQTDAMTGLLNKRTLMTRLTEVVAKATMSGEAVALLMIDLDGFKNYNDAQGHLAGDAFLERVGDALRAHTRPQDVAGRFGGDEFLLALFGCDAVVASDVARRLLADIERIQEGEDQPWPRVTASCGVSVMPQDGNNVESLIKAADTCLLYAKQLGKKRLFVSGLSLDQDLSRRWPLR
jgi:diguanylate cyclase (GGDEF)-like protein